MQSSVAWWKETLYAKPVIECLQIPIEPVSYLLLCIDPVLQGFIVLYVNCEKLI